MQARYSRVIILCFAFTIAGTPALAAAAPGSATLSWYPPTESTDGSALTNLAGYRIYYGRSATKLTKSIKIDNPGLTRYAIEDLAAAKWHFAMTSVTSQGKESARSTTVSKKIT